jgi:hypothetical protein
MTTIGTPRPSIPGGTGTSPFLDPVPANTYTLHVVFTHWTLGRYTCVTIWSRSRPTMSPSYALWTASLFLANRSTPAYHSMIPRSTAQRTSSSHTLNTSHHRMRYITNFKVDCGWPITACSTVRSPDACERDIESFRYTCAAPPAFPVWIRSSTRSESIERLQRYEQSRKGQRAVVFVVPQDYHTCSVHTGDSACAPIVTGHDLSLDNSAFRSRVGTGQPG